MNGTSLHDRAAGSGPAVVLLHGVPKTSYHWRHLVPKLTPHYTAVVPDLRGLGAPARPSDGYDSATMSDDVVELMNHLGHQTYAVAGEGWGAVIGYQLVARRRSENARPGTAGASRPRQTIWFRTTTRPPCPHQRPAGAGRLMANYDAQSRVSRSPRVVTGDVERAGGMDRSRHVSCHW